MLSQRAKAIKPFIAMELLARARELEAQGRDIVHMELGEPDRSAPDHLVEAAFRAIKDGYTTYTPTEGISPLREAIAEFYLREYNVKIDTDRIIVTMGVSPALFLIFGAILEAGDEVVIHEPYYSPYPKCISYMGGIPKHVILDASAGFPIDAERLIKTVTSKTRAILINSPSNPTGMMIDHEGLKKLADSGVTVISDEIYHRITYGTKATSILEFTDNCWVLNGFSKVYGMTGWRLGWVICPMGCSNQLKAVHQNFFLSANAFVQMAGVKALTGSQDFVTETVEIYNKRREFLVEELKRLGWAIGSEPQGAFYILADVSSTGLDGMNVSQRLLEEAGVAVTPGLDFGEAASRFIRFSYATDLKRIEVGVERIADWLKRINKTI